MIKYYREKDKEPELEIEGNLLDTVAEVTFLIHWIHVLLSSQNIFLGRIFERALRDPDFMDKVFKPCSEDENILKGTRGGFVDE